MTTTDLMAAPLSKRLKAETNDTHERLDQRIMAADPFGSRALYGRFLAVQHQFHRDIDALYDHPQIAARVPDLDERRRLAQIEDDIADLDQHLPEATGAPAFASAEGVDLATAFGWLYVAEGSNLGAAFLYKAAAALGLDAGFGARHLAGHPDGRARHWRGFTAVLDGLDLDAEGEKRAIEGARAAFMRVHGLVETHFG